VVSEIFQSVVDDEVGGLEEKFLGDVTAEGVPVVPLLDEVSMCIEYDGLWKR
jgi:hypothetical protein